MIKALAAKLGMHHFKIANSDLVANIYAQNESKLVNVFFSAKLAAPCIVSMHSFEVGIFSFENAVFFCGLISFIFTRRHFIFLLWEGQRSRFSIPKFNNIKNNIWLVPVLFIVDPEDGYPNCLEPP